MKLSKMAVISLVLAILGIYIFPPVNLIALIIGFIALNKIRHSAGALKGKAIVITGIIISCIAIITTVSVVISYRQHYQAFKLPGDTMTPTINKDERIIIDKKAYASILPDRGDIVVFQLTLSGHKKLLCKRIIGLPNENLEIKDGKIYINNNLTLIPGLPKETYYLNGGDFGKQAIKIPDGSYYLLGDNSNKSQDSRYFGFIKKPDLIGKVILQYSKSTPIRQIADFLKNKGDGSN